MWGRWVHRTSLLRGRHRRGSRGRPLGTPALIAACILVLAACAPPAAPAPTTAPAKPAEASKPADAAKPAAAAPAAAAKPADAAKPATGAKPEARGAITIAMNEEVPTMLMWDSYNSYGYPIIRNIAEGLVNRDPATNQLVGELATKWEAANPTTWRFTLRPNVKFHDGTPFNAEAAAVSLNDTWSKEKNYKIRTFIGPEFQAKPVDELTLDVVTESPDPILPERLYFSPIGSAKQLKEKPDETPLKAIGTGPYTFVEWQKGQHLKITANPDWWGHGNPDARGAATIKDVTFVFRGEREVRASMTKAGEADLARWLTREQCEGSPACQSSPGIETIFVRMDQAHVAMKDKRVREAIALSIDKGAIINDLMGGGEIARQLVGPSALGHNPSLQPYPYDPERAKQLVAEAKAAGIPVEAELTNYSRRAYMVGLEESTEAIVEMMIQVGLPNVKARIIETAAHADLWGAPKPIDPNRGMLGTHAHGNELMDYSSTVRAYYTCQAPNSVVCDEKIEEMHKAALPLQGEARAKAYQEIARYVHEQVYTVPIGHPNFYYGMSKRLEWKPRLDGFIMVKEMKLTQ